MKSQIHGTLGIIVSETKHGVVSFSESIFAQKLCQIAGRQGLIAFAFTPKDITEDMSIQGYTFQDGVWQLKMFPLPDLIYDRCFCSGAAQAEKHQKLAMLSHLRRFRYLSRGLAGKWLVYEKLRQLPAAASHLPKTYRYHGAKQLQLLLPRWNGHAFLKPQHGTHGKLTLHISQVDPYEPVKLTGRNAKNQIIQVELPSLQEVGPFINTFRKGKPFLIQPYLPLTTHEGEPYDIRVLMQKGAIGRWSMTGIAARVGQTGSLTSNLHGGGKAMQAEPMLRHELGSATATTVLHQIRELSYEIPEFLEGQFGRLAELGLDFGVDKAGNVWILEVNSKPGRSAFESIGDLKSAKKAVENPILYACYLLQGI